MVGCHVYSSEMRNEIRLNGHTRCTRLKWEMKYAWTVSCQMYSSEMRNEIRLNGQIPDVLVWNEKWKTPEWSDVLVWIEKWNTPEWSDVRCTPLKWEMKYAWMVRCQVYSSEMRNEIRLNGQMPGVFVWNEKWNTSEWSDARCTRLNWKMKYAWMVRYQMYSSEMRNEIWLDGRLPDVFVWNEKWNTPEWSVARCSPLKWEIKYAWTVGQLPDILVWNEKWNMPERSDARCTRLNWEMKYAWIVIQMPDIPIWNQK